MKKFKKTNRKWKHVAILRLGVALTDVTTDVFLILWLHDEHPELENLMYLSLSALVLSFCVGLVCLVLSCSQGKK